jgi:hypothetical protein
VTELERRLERLADRFAAAAMERELRADANAALLAGLFRAAEPERPRADGEALMASVRDAQLRLEEIAGRPGRRGVWPDGSRVSAELKRQVFERWERARDEHRRRGGGITQPVFASASPDGGPSPMTRRIYGLD